MGTSARSASRASVSRAVTLIAEGGAAPELVAYVTRAPDAAPFDREALAAALAT